MIDADLGLFSERRRAKMMITEIRIVSNVSPRLRNRIILVSTNYKQELLLHPTDTEGSWHRMTRRTLTDKSR